MALAPSQTASAIILSHTGANPISPEQLLLARLRLAWADLMDVAEQLDLVPIPAREHVAAALSELVLAKAAVDEAGSTEEKIEC